MQTIYLDISNKGVYPCVYAKQTDVGRKFKVVLTDSGVPYEIPNGSLVSIWFNGASGEGNYSEINGNSATEILGNTIIVELIKQMLKVPGDGIVCLILNDSNGNQIGSWNLQYIVEFVPGVDSKVATEYYTAFSESVKQLGELAKKLVIDDTLSVEGAAADAAKTGALLNEKAPSGFGLGTQAVNPPNNSLDEAVLNGWYVTSPSFTGAPTGHANIGYGAVLVTNRGGVIIQEYTSTASSTILGYPIKLIRTKNESGAWTEWEWVNPPMQAGVEYRTTERFSGKPVYAMIVDCGYAPNNGVKSIQYASDKDAVSPIYCTGQIVAVAAASGGYEGGYLGEFLSDSYCFGSGVGGVFSVNAFANNIWITTNKDRTPCKVLAYVKYVKK